MPLDFPLFLDYMTRTLWALLVVVAALLAARGVRSATTRVLSQKRAQANVTVLLSNFAQIAMVFGGALVVVAIYTRDAFGWILTSFSVVGVVVGLALQDIMKNFLAGIWVLVERPFGIGDTIEVDGHTGVVDEIRFRTTQLRTADGREAIIPNGTFMTNAVVNVTRFPTRRAAAWLIVDDTERPIGAEEIRAALAGLPQLVTDPPPAVELRSVSEGKARYIVNFWASDRDQAISAAVRALRARYPNGEVHGG